MEGTSKNSEARRLKKNQANILKANRGKYLKGNMLLSQNMLLSRLKTNN